MYDKIQAALKVSTADSSIVDLYTVYEYVSVMLSRDMKNYQYKTTSINVSRLASAVEHVQEDRLKSCFFDSDKIVYGKLNLGGAMTTAGYTPEEQAFFLRVAHGLLTPPVRTNHSTEEMETQEDERVRGTQV